MQHEQNNPLPLNGGSSLADEQIAEHLVGLLQSLENHSYGEAVNLLEHSLQTAAAVRDARDDALTLGALFHDVGHVLIEAGRWGAPDHARAAANHLEAWLSPEIVEPIRLHVEAKQYLVATDPGYHDRLSAASIETLRQQGGALDPRSAEQFAAHPSSGAAIQLRLADDAGKVASLDVGDLDQYRPMIERALAEHAAARVVSAEWARDACRCPECRDPRNRQHLIDSTDLVGWSVVATHHEAVTIVTIRHADGREHECVIPDTDVGDERLPSKRWGGEHAEHLGAGVVDASGPLDRFVVDLAEYDIALACGVPTDEGAILDFVRRFGHVRTTNYGELFDVRADPEPINLAFTPAGLPLHTDNPYRDAVPTVQVLHCLRGATEGGGSLFADGFAAAERLRELDRIAFDTLASTPMTFRFERPRARVTNVEANQKFTPKVAIRLGRRLDEFDLHWIEEPVSADDLAGHADVRSALDTKFASGETEYTRFGMQAMIDARSADVLMPDLQRIGGYTEFRRAAAAADAQHVPVSNHFFTEYSLALSGSLPNCISVEHIDWFAPLFREQIEMCDGRLVIADRPGHGFTFDDDIVGRRRIR